MLIFIIAISSLDAHNAVFCHNCTFWQHLQIRMMFAENLWVRSGQTSECVGTHRIQHFIILLPPVIFCFVITWSFPWWMTGRKNPVAHLTLKVWACKTEGLISIPDAHWYWQGHNGALQESIHKLKFPSAPQDCTQEYFPLYKGHWSIGQLKTPAVCPQLHLAALMLKYWCQYGHQCQRILFYLSQWIWNELKNPVWILLFITLKKWH